MRPSEGEKMKWWAHGSPRKGKEIKAPPPKVAAGFIPARKGLNAQ